MHTRASKASQSQPHSRKQQRNRSYNKHQNVKYSQKSLDITHNGANLSQISAKLQNQGSAIMAKTALYSQATTMKTNLPTSNVTSIRTKLQPTVQTFQQHRQFSKGVSQNIDNEFSIYASNSQNKKDNNKTPEQGSYFLSNQYAEDAANALNYGEKEGTIDAVDLVMPSSSYSSNHSHNGNQKHIIGKAKKILSK